MIKKIVIVILLILVFGCTSKEIKNKYSSQRDYFENLKGCFLLYNIKTQTFDKRIGDSVCGEKFPACSTFKVPLAVMAFDSGTLKDENEILKWDGVKGFREELNHDHDAKSWLKDSVVWFSQRITNKLGEKKLQKYLNDFNYGNKDIKAGITKAWLVSPSEVKPALKISAYQQVDFMNKLWTNALPVSIRSMDLTRKITYLEKSPKGYELSGKTGSNFYDSDHKIHLGWFIAHLNKDDQEYIVVTSLSDLKPNEIKSYGGLRAKELTKQILVDEGLW